MIMTVIVMSSFTIMPCNLLSLIWIVSGCAVMVAYFLKQYVGEVRELYLFGKLKNKTASITISPSFVFSSSEKMIKLIKLFSSVPKRYFLHFYVSGLVVHCVVIYVFFMSAENGVFTTMCSAVNFLCSTNVNEDDVKREDFQSVALILLLELIQISRRLYECLYVSVFSSGNMSIVHYFYGVFLYCTFGFGLLSSLNYTALPYTWDFTGHFQVQHGAALFLFIVSSLYQHKTMQTFAKLRSDTKEKSKEQHFIPRGHLFELVSCPHYLCELVIYLSFCLTTSFRNSYLMSVTFFVWVNQLLASLLTHRWYQETFSHYPSQRKAVIPYIW